MTIQLPYQAGDKVWRMMHNHPYEQVITRVQINLYIPRSPDDAPPQRVVYTVGDKECTVVEIFPTKKALLDSFLTGDSK